MGKTFKLPAIDHAKVRRRLERARTERLWVRIRRWIPRSDRIDGYVVGIGGAWVVLATLDDRCRPDGWIFLRLEDIQAVKLDRDPEVLSTRILRARGQWPPAEPEVQLDSVEQVLRSAAALSRFVTVHEEFDDPGSCWIGALRQIGDDHLRLHLIDPRAHWHAAPTLFDLDDLTRIDAGAGYEAALALVAGPLPEDA